MGLISAPCALQQLPFVVPAVTARLPNCVGILVGPVAVGRRLLQGKDRGGYLHILESVDHVATSCLASAIFKTASTEWALSKHWRLVFGKAKQGLNDLILFVVFSTVRVMTVSPSPGEHSLAEGNKECRPINMDRVCAIVVRVLGYRYGGPGSIPGTTRKKSSGSGTESTKPREYNWGDTW
jgi:hypothetical protein